MRKLFIVELLGAHLTLLSTILIHVVVVFVIFLAVAMIFKEHAI